MSKKNVFKRWKFGLWTGFASISLVPAICASAVACANNGQAQNVSITSNDLAFAIQPSPNPTSPVIYLPSTSPLTTLTPQQALLNKYFSLTITEITTSIRTYVEQNIKSLNLTVPQSTTTQTIPVNPNLISIDDTLLPTAEGNFQAPPGIQVGNIYGTLAVRIIYNNGSASSLAILIGGFQRNN